MPEIEGGGDATGSKGGTSDNSQLLSEKDLPQDSNVYQDFCMGDYLHSEMLFLLKLLKAFFPHFNR